MDKTLKIAIPNKGRLSTKIYELLNNAGLNFNTKDERALKIATKDGKFSLIFVRTQDIPNFIEAKAADIGFTGVDVVVESGVELDIVKEFDFGKCDMVVALPEDSNINDVKDLPSSINVATSFPNIAKDYFKKIGKEAKVIEVTGAVEITPSLGLADVVIDITSTGSTLKQNRLKIVDSILSSSACVVASKNLNEEKKAQLNSLIRALNSVIDAQQKKYLMAHVPKNQIEQVKKIIPGLSSPTVTNLYGDDDNVVVHVVVDSDKIYDSIDNLKAIGGKGILILDVHQMVR